MNTISPQEKRPLRIIGIGLGLVTGVVIIAWLVINIVNAVPGSFTSLASLAESVRSYQLPNNEEPSMNELVVTSDSTVVQSGASVRLDWTAATTPGSFVFTYDCTDGVAIDLNSDEGTRSLSCDTNYNLGNVTNASLSIDSTKNRYVDLPYSVAFLQTDATEPDAVDTAVLTVVNDTISIVDEDTPAEETPVAETPATPTTPTTPTTPGTPTYTTEYTYAIPVSDPNGRSDLSVRFLNTGRIVGNTFVAGTVDREEEGAIQFEVKNLGTKTSNSWSYESSLPTGGRFESTAQTSLKPNERAVITIGFPAGSSATHTFTVDIESTGDSASLNNQFSQTVRFTN